MNSIISTQKYSKQHHSMRLGKKRKYASKEQAETIGKAIKLLNKAKAAETESEYFLRLSDAFKVIRDLARQ